VTGGYHRKIYCDGAKWHGGALAPISQFMGRLARANRAPKVNRHQDTHHRQTRTDRDREDTHTTQVIHFRFNSIVFRRSFQEVFNVSAFRTRLFPPPLLVESCTGNDSLLTHISHPHYITRKPGEELDPTCITKKVQRKYGWMF
jgi:hypothetical protein